MLVRKSRLDAAETRMEASESYAKWLVAEIAALKEEVARLEREKDKSNDMIDDMRLLNGAKFDFSHKDLKKGMEVFHQMGVESRIITKNPKGKYELLYNAGGSWKTTAMGEVDSLEDIAKYMKRSNYFVKGK